jgi:hypothetical protein
MQRNCSWKTVLSWTDAVQGGKSMKLTQTVLRPPPSTMTFAHPVPEPAEAGQKEIFSSWALFILIMLLITALFTSYMLQQKKIQAVHETVISIFAGQSKPLCRCSHKSLTAQHRYAGGLNHKGHTGTSDPGQCQLRLSVLLQSTTSSYHSGFGLRTTSGISAGNCEQMVQC